MDDVVVQKCVSYGIVFDRSVSIMGCIEQIRTNLFDISE